MKPLSFLSLFIFFILFSACKDDDPIIGSISFTSSADCNIRLFDSRGKQIARVYYELGKAPAVVQMNRSGVYIVRAVNSNAILNEPLAYQGGDIVYLIEFH